MKQSLVVFLIFFTFLNGVAQQATINGQVKNFENKEFITSAKIQISDKVFQTNDSGRFSIQLAEGKYNLIFSKEGYQATALEIELLKGETKDLGNIFLTTYNEVGDLDIVTISDADLDNEQDEINVSQILHGSRDPFLSSAGYNLGSFRFRVRGYDSEYNSVYINGMNFNDAENGRAYWYLWGGLNDVTRNKIVTNSLDAADYAVNSVGGGTNISTYSKDNSPGFRFTYSSANVSYRNRAMLSYSSGVTRKGWAVSLSGSRRWSDEGYVDATLYDAYAYFLSVDKKINARNYINFTTFAAPSTRGRQGASLQEVYDLVGTNFYNPYWGYQNDKKRNSRISKSFLPVFNLNYEFRPKNNILFKTSLGYTFGYNNSTSLNWYNASDPRPDYYRYLPSYQMSDAAKAIRTSEFQTDPSVSQVNWAHLYEVNRNSSETINDVDGIAGNDVSGKLSQYIVEDRHSAQNIAYANLLFSNEVNSHFKYIVGAYGKKYVSTHYKTIDDLLGGEFWEDIDKYAERDYGSGDFAQNDLAHPNRLVKEGDEFGYKYDANINYAEIWTNEKYTTAHWIIDASLKGSTTQFWRTGYMQNGKFPDNSVGDSKKYSFINYSAILGVTYKLNGRNYFSTNIASFTKAPNFMNSFISPRTRNSVVDDLKNENILSGDVSYNYRSPAFKMRLSAYYTQFDNQIWTRSFYHDGYHNYVNYSMTGISKTHAGVELGAEVKITSSLSASLAAYIGNFIWNSNPKVKVTIDSKDSVLTDNEIVYQSGYKVSGKPQNVATLGLRYSGVKHWFAGVNANYAQNAYLSLNPTRRTANAVLGVDEATKAMILGQEELPVAYTLDLFAGKSFKFRDYYLRINLSVKNLLNNTNFKTGGYEQLRYDEASHDITKFPPKYYYMYGTTYFLNISINF